MKKVLKFVKGKKDEKKENGGITPSQSGELLSGAQTPEEEKFLALENTSRYLIDLSGKNKTLTKLHKAAWQGNLEKLKSALKKSDVDAVDSRNRTALHFAVAEGHPNIAWFLLGNNADINIRDDEGSTPLLKAVEYNHKECLKLLIERGADINAANFMGNTGLHIATSQEALETVSIILNNGAKTEVSNNAGDHPLHIAIKSGSENLVNLFLKSGAAANCLDVENRTPLMLAAKSGNPQLVNLLSGYCLQQLTAVDSNGWTAEDYARLNGHENIVKYLNNLKGNKRGLPKECSTQIATSNSESSKETEKASDLSCGVTETNRSDNSKLEKSPEFFANESKTESICDKEKSEEAPDSPNVDVMPPYCKPPRSWDIIQAGMIDNKCAEPKRRSLTTLGTLHSRRDSFVENVQEVSPKHTHSLNRRKDAKTNSLFVQQRHSLDAEKLLKTWSLKDAQYVISAHAKNSDQLVNSTSSAAWKMLYSEKPEAMDLLTGETEESIQYSISSSEDWNKVSSKDGTLGKTDTMKECEEISVANPHFIVSDSVGETEHHKSESENSFSTKDEHFPPPPTALELGADIAKSMKYLKGISEDHPDGSNVVRNIWKKANERHSLDCLEEKCLPETSLLPKELSDSPQKWKSLEIPRGQKTKDQSRDTNKRINEQLECYDQALRELAQTPTTKKTLGSHYYYSLPSSRAGGFDKSTNHVPQQKLFRDDGPFSDPLVPSNKDKEVGKRNYNHEAVTGNNKPAKDNAKVSSNDLPLNWSNEEKKNKKHILLAMREVKHGVHMANTFDKTSSDNQISSPATKLDACFYADELLGHRTLEDFRADSVPEENLHFDFGMNNTSLERNGYDRKSQNGSDTEEEPTLWLQDNVKREGKESKNRLNGSDEDFSDISEEHSHKRTSSFSPLGIIYREMEKESQKGLPKEDKSSAISTEVSKKNQDGFRETVHAELQDGCRDLSPDISLSSGPIEPLGAEKDSGSDGEGNPNDVTPTHLYFFKSQQDWLKCHLKNATLEKNKLEEIAAQLLEKAERLQYELADAKEATKSRDEVIKLLQDQLARMETAYTKSLEDSVQSRLQLTSHEQEIHHLKEICFKYEEEINREDAEPGDNNIKKLEFRIKKLEGEKERMREEIVQLEQEKTSLVKRLQELTESEEKDKCQRWKEGCEKEKDKTSEKESNKTKAYEYSNEIAEKETRLERKISELEKTLLEMTRENMGLNSNLQRLQSELESERQILNAKTNIHESICEHKKKNLELEAYIKSLKKEMKDKNKLKLQEKENEIQFLGKQYSHEKELLIKSYEGKLFEREFESGKIEEYKRENELLKEMIKNLKDQVTSLKDKYSLREKKDEPTDLKHECELITKTVSERQCKDNCEVKILLKENAELKSELRKLKLKMTTADEKSEEYVIQECENGQIENDAKDLRKEMNSLTVPLAFDGRLSSDACLTEKQAAETQNRVALKKRIGKEDQLAWGSLYGMKESDKQVGCSPVIDTSPTNWRGNKVKEVNESRSSDVPISSLLDKIELHKLKREIEYLRRKIASEKALREALENQIYEITLNLSGNNSLQQEVNCLKKKLNREFARKCDVELAEYHKNVQAKREKYLMESEENVGKEYKKKCELLAREREKSKEIKNKILGEEKRLNSANESFTSLADQQRFSPTLLIEPGALMAAQYQSTKQSLLEPEIKDHLTKELDRSIVRHRAVSSSSSSSTHLELLQIQKDKREN